MLAYVFWHEPLPDVERLEYERRLRDFHRALTDDPPAGFVASKAYRSEGATWLQVEVGYEDWYLVEAWASLADLNEAAVTGSRQEPHDTVARLAAGGRAGIYRLLRGVPHGGEKRFAVWLNKPRETTYPEFLSRLESVEATTGWQRVMLLGPGPEFCLAGLDARPKPDFLPDEWGPILVDRTLVWPELEF